MSIVPGYERWRSEVIAAIETGDHEAASRAATQHAAELLHGGAPLDTVLREVSQHIDALAQSSPANAQHALDVVRQTVIHLTEDMRDRMTFEGKSEEKDVLGLLHVSKCMLAYSFGNPAAALDIADAGKPYLVALASPKTIAQHHLYRALALCALARRATGDAREKRLREASEDRAFFERSATETPANRVAKRSLVEAEVARAEGRAADATELFEGAIRLAGESGNAQEEALGYELAAGLYLDLGRPKLAAVYFVEAADSYERWGARAKVAALKAEHQALVATHRRDAATAPCPVEGGMRELQQKLEERTRELHDAREQLLTQERLASLGALMAGIAHEIKNPLNFVVNFAELSLGLVADVRESLASGAPAKAMIEEIEDTLDVLGQNVRKIGEHGARANNIVNGMLLTSRGGATKHESADFNSMIAEGIDLGYHGYRGKAPGFNVKIDAAYEPGLGTVEMATQDIVRVLINVINNACYSMHEKQHTASPGYTPTLTVRTRSNASEVEVRIRDNGTGIPESVLGKVWSPFFTTKPPGEGTGLGLSICHDIVVQGHQGSMQLETAAGEFTEFIITLPKRQRPSSIPPSSRTSMFG
jgi:signal transduction histidine kinase